MKTIIVWFRNDLRIHDHPALAQAAKDADHVIPLFILDTKLLASGSNRARFLLESLQDLKDSLKTVGADLIIREGDQAKVLNEFNADAVYYTADFTPYAIKRDKTVKAAITTEFRAFPGRLIVSSLDKLNTKAGKPHKIFTPFWKNWMEIERRAVAKKPSSLSLPSGVRLGSLPSLASVTTNNDVSKDALKGGEAAGRKQLKKFLNNSVDDYKENNNLMALDGTSRTSSYLHFGCLSAREIEDMIPDNEGGRAWRRQLCWRDFYHYILFKNPGNATQEFQERYRTLKWASNETLLHAWQQGKTGYPVVDAAMRQMNAEAWMHNRARLIVGSFLTKDLWLDWRLGEAYFMKMLIDGDKANNNGNWQWIASVGVDPAPVFRRLYNPTLQQKNFDPDGVYVRKYVPELKDVPDKYLAEPWTMPAETQTEIGCVIGKDYPKPVVDHKEARVAALEHYRNA